jgi:hypothetical protein
MHIRAIALAIPLVMGIAACKTSSTQSTRGGETASTSEPRSDTDRTASSGTYGGTDTSASAPRLRPSRSCRLLFQLSVASSRDEPGPLCASLEQPPASNAAMPARILRRFMPHPPVSGRR